MNILLIIGLLTVGAAGLMAWLAIGLRLGRKCRIPDEFPILKRHWRFN